MRWLLALLTVIPTTLAFGQVRSVEPIAPGLPFTGPDAPAFSGVLSADGNVLAFTSYATNLTPGAKPSWISLYVQTLSDRRIHRIPTTTSSSISRFRICANGRRIAFSQASTAYVYDRTTDAIRNVSFLPDGKSALGSVEGMSRDGTKLLLRLSPKFEQNYKHYLYDFTSRQTSHIQLSSSGAGLTSFENPKMTNDGTSIIFRSKDSRLPGGGSDFNLYRKSLGSGLVELLSSAKDTLVDIDAKGSSVLLRGPSFSQPGFSVLNTSTGRKVNFPQNLVSAKLSPDGNYVFGTIEDPTYITYGPIVSYRVSDGAMSTVLPRTRATLRVLSTSADGSRLVVSRVTETGLGTLDVYDRNGVQVPNIDTNLPGAANGRIASIAMSADGSRVAYSTDSTNIVSQPITGTFQVYVRNVPDRTTAVESIGSDGSPVRGDVESLDLSSNGRYLAYCVKRLTLPNQFTLVVRDLETRKNIGQRSYIGYPMQVSVKNDGRTALTRYVGSDYLANFFDPFTAKDSDLSALVPSGSLVRSVWVAADGDQVTLSIVEQATQIDSLLRIAGDATRPDLIALPRDAYPSSISEDGKRVGLYTNVGSFRILDLETGVDSQLPIPASYTNTAIHFSGNGRYVSIGQYIYDFQTKHGWYVETSDPYTYGVTNGADPLLFASEKIGGISISHAYVPYLVRVDRPILNPSTFTSPIYTVARGSVTIASSGHSFQEPSENLKFQYRVGSGDWTAPGPAQQTLILPEDGVHVISVRSVDSAGRVDLTPATVTVTSDSTPPTLRVNARAKRSAVKIEASASEGCNWILRVRLPSGAFVAEKYQYGAAASFEGLVEGLTPNTSYEYELVASDRAGLQATATGTFQTGP